MNHSTIPHSLLSEFNDYLTLHTGLNFKESRWPELERGLQKASLDFGFQDSLKCVQWLLHTPLTKNQIEILSRHLTVGETYFFRDPTSFEVLDNVILPDLLSERGKEQPRSLRIWSTACSTGEEAYSIAMLLDGKKNLLKNWDITLLATDINTKALEQARSGLYSEWSFRGIPATLKNKYFTKTPAKLYQLNQEIINMVLFEYLNLAEDHYPSLLNSTHTMNIIFCRNVLMYFAPEKAKWVITQLYHSLVMGGWLVVAPTDAFHLLDAVGFQKETQFDSIFRKGEKTTPVEVVPEPELFVVPVQVAVVAEAPEAGQPLFSETDTVFTEAVDDYKAALVLYQQGNYREILTRYGMAHEGLRQDGGVTNDTMATLVARCYANLGRLNDGLTWCEKAITANKLAVNGYYLKAIILQEMEREDEALQELKRCLYIDPDSILVLFTLGHIYWRRHQERDALRYFKQALTILENYEDEAVVSPEEGLTAARMRDIIHKTLAIHTGAHA